MAIKDRVDGAKRLLDKVSLYNRLVIENSLEQDTIDDMKGNAKDICDDVKAEIDNIKSEIDQWS